MEELIAYRQELLSALQQVVDQIRKTANLIPTSAWYLPFERNSHTPHFILAQLRELEAHFFTIQLPRFTIETLPLLPVFDEFAWMASHYRAGEPIVDILGSFSQLRYQELIWLRNISPADWSCLARHPWWGVHTLQWWVELQLEYSQHCLSVLTPSSDV